MDRPATLTEADRVVRTRDRRTPERILADVLHAAGYLVPDRLPGVDDRRAYSARLVRDGLALLALAGGGPTDVIHAAVAVDLYRRAGDDPRTVGERAPAADTAAAAVDAAVEARTDYADELDPIVRRRAVAVADSLLEHFDAVTAAATTDGGGIRARLITGT